MWPRREVDQPVLHTIKKALLDLEAAGHADLRLAATFDVLVNRDRPVAGSSRQPARSSAVIRMPNSTCGAGHTGTG